MLHAPVVPVPSPAPQVIEDAPTSVKPSMQVNVWVTPAFDALVRIVSLGTMQPSSREGAAAAAHVICVHVGNVPAHAGVPLLYVLHVREPAA